MSILSKAQWLEIEQAYCETSETIRSIAERYGIVPETIQARRRRNGWPPRHPRMARANGGYVPVNKADLVDRFYGLINLKLEQMEEDMARSSERTPADNERETRALGTLIRNFEKVFGLEQESGNDGKQSDSKPEGSAEAEALRRELAERLVRLRETKAIDGEGCRD